jgi:hypothetical protein
MCGCQEGKRIGIFGNGISYRFNQKERTSMEQVKVYYDRKGNTFTNRL